MTHRDAAALYELLNQPGISRYNDYGINMSREEIRAYIQGDIENFLTGQGLRLTIHSLAGSELLGSIGLSDIDLDKGSAVIGFEIDQKHQRQGIMTDALSHLLNYFIPVYYQGRLKSVTAYVHPDNVPSQKLLLRHGFKICDPGNAVRNKRLHTNSFSYEYVFRAKPVELPI